MTLNEIMDDFDAGKIDARTAIRRAFLAGQQVWADAFATKRIGEQHRPDITTEGERCSKD